MERKINEAAKLAGVTVRTLHYYDKIGLLRPDRVTETGYRMYGDRALETLQQILFFRELQFPLETIKQIMTAPYYDGGKALKRQRELLVRKRERLDALISLVDETMRGEKDMSFKQFDRTEIEKAKTEYAAEVKERWGATGAWRESEEKTSAYGGEDWERIGRKQDEIMRAFARNRGEEPGSEAVQELVRRWQDFISRNFYSCTKEILSGLGKMYTGDERFRKNLDGYGEGTARLMAEAIGIYCGVD